jgi:hypothetical protein
MGKRLEGVSTKLVAMVLVLGLPAIGLLLVDLANRVGDTNIFYIGVVLIFLFPGVIAANLLFHKGK